MRHHILKSQPPCYDDAHDDTHFNTEEPVSPERDDPIDDQDHELYEDVPPRSIFAATWFRVVLVVIVLGVVGAVAVPYVLDWMNPPPATRTAATTRSPMTSAPTIPPAVEKPVTDRLLADRSSSDRPVAEKKDSTVVPAPASERAPMPAAPAAPSTKPSAEPGAAAKPAAPDAKSEAKRAAPGDTKSQSAMAVTEKPAKPSSPKPSAAVKPEAAPKAAAAEAASKRVVAKATGPAATASGPYWVQIGAFKDAESAKRVAAKLREENFKVEESTRRVGGAATAAAAVTPPSAPAGTADQYNVFVTGMSAEELNRRLAGKGLASESSSGGGLVVKPSLPLRDAVALSKDLAVEGFKVQVRRAGAAASAPAVVSTPTSSPTSGSGESGQMLHRVRVGAFTDRAAALAAARELESKGFKPYIARGDQ